MPLNKIKHNIQREILLGILPGTSICKGIFLYDYISGLYKSILVIIFFSNRIYSIGT